MSLVSPPRIPEPLHSSGMSPRYSRPFEGNKRRLVVAFDIGTTYSGVSYSILDPGDVPKIYTVTRFPCQEQAGGDSKVPTIIYYNKAGVARAIGAEAVQDFIVEQANEAGWTKAEWFKLHLCPKSLSAKHLTDKTIPPLPRNKTVIDVFADFLRYLFKCTGEYIRETHAYGDALWSSLERGMHFVLSHPNGWDGQQQRRMLRAAVKAGLIQDSPAEASRVQFVTEGEASLHFCVESKLSNTEITAGNGVIVVDAGGGTIDISAYCLNDQSQFEEIAPAECRLQGSVLINRRAQTFLEDKLRGTRFGSPEEIKHMVGQFDKSTKTKFKDIAETSYIKFGGIRDNNHSLGIRNGSLRLTGDEIAALFEPSIAATLEAITLQLNAATRQIKSVFLVGGFAASNWLFTRLRDSLQSFGVGVCRPDQNVNKAVSDGAISFYHNHFVSTRIAKWTYGIQGTVSYEEKNPEHQRRLKSLVVVASGQKLVGQWFHPIICKGTKVSEKTEFTNRFFVEKIGKTRMHPQSLTLICYRGQCQPAPNWIDSEPEMFQVLCKVSVDISATINTKTRVRSKGRLYYDQGYKIVLLFGLTELQAQLSWVENGVEKRSPATVVYDCGEDEEDA